MSGSALAAAQSRPERQKLVNGVDVSRRGPEKPFAWLMLAIPAWPRRGLDDRRATIGQRARGPALLVRRSKRAGALSPVDTMTQCAWCSYTGPVAVGATTSGEW
jgi:hypothetical protein